SPVSAFLAVVNATVVPSGAHSNFCSSAVLASLVQPAFLNLPPAVFAHFPNSRLPGVASALALSSANIAHAVSRQAAAVALRTIAFPPIIPSVPRPSGRASRRGLPPGIRAVKRAGRALLPHGAMVLGHPEPMGQGDAARQRAREGAEGRAVVAADQNQVLAPAPLGLRVEAELVALLVVDLSQVRAEVHGRCL